VLAEFSPKLTVIVADTVGNRRVYSLGDLLLDAFVPGHLDSTKDVRRKT